MNQIQALFNSMETLASTLKLQYLGEQPENHKIVTQRQKLNKVKQQDRAMKILLKQLEQNWESLKQQVTE